MWKASSPSPARRAWTPSIPATGSCPKTRPCRVPASRPESPLSAPAPNCWTCSAIRPPPAGLRQKAGIPVVPGTEDPVDGSAKTHIAAQRIGFPLIVKAAFGGGGRGMRVVDTPSDLESKFDEARARSGRRIRQRCGVSGALYPSRETRRGSDPRRPARQHPAPVRARLLRAAPPPEGGGSRAGRRARCRRSATRLADAAVALARTAGYYNAGTVEFLVDVDSGEWFFIEVNPRIQVEHTVTEMVTGIDIVRCQIQVAQGHSLHGRRSALPPQDEIPLHGYALQCRVTTEDPANNFMPGLRQDPHLSFARRLRHPAGRRLGLRRRGDHAVLRFAAGKVTAWGTTFPRCLPAHGPRAPRVPHPRREDQHPVPRKRRQPPEVPGRRARPRRSSTRTRSCSSSRRARIARPSC